MIWVPCRDQGGTLTSDRVEWEEKYNVYEFVPPPGTRAWDGLLRDQPQYRPGSRHPDYPGAVVDQFDPRPLGTSDGWEIAVRYRNQDEDDESNPLDRRTRIKLTSESKEIAVFEDADGNPNVNSAGDLLVGETKTLNLWVFSFELNVPGWPNWAVAGYEDAVNADDVNIRGLTVPRHSGLLRGLDLGDFETHDAGNGRKEIYYPLRFQVVYHPLTWKARVYDRGLYEIGDDGEPTRLADANGDPVTEPVFLDGRGRRPRTADGKIKAVLDPGDFHVFERWYHQRLPFRRLPLT